MLLSVEGCGHLWELDVCGWVEVICGCSMFVGGGCGHQWERVVCVVSYLWALVVVCGGGVMFICM